MNAQQLRNSILQMAIQGKLVPQDPSEEPASVLLEKIKEWKNSIVGQGKKCKKEKSCDWETPFDIPSSWVWAKWGEVSSSIQYGYNAPAKEHGRIKMVRISDIHDNKIFWDGVPYCDIDENEIDNYKLQVNDILFARTGGTVGKSYLVSDITEDAIFAGYLIRTHYNSALIEPLYLKFFMESGLYWSQLRDGTIATAQPNCNGQKLAAMYLPLPPLAEQKRIVAKLEELLPLVEQYGKAQENLDALNNDLPRRLRQSILQEAIQGKLVPQDEKDGTADFLSSLKEAKSNAFAESIIKKSDSKVWGIDEEDVPFEIPATWQWYRLSDIANMYTGDSINTEEKLAKYTNVKGRFYIGTKDVGFDHAITYDNGVAIPAQYEPNFKIAKAGSILLCVEGGSAGRKIGRLNQDVCFGNKLCCFTPYIPVNDFLYYYLQSSLFTDVFRSNVSGIIGGVSVNTLKALPIPLPPLAEQKRIVAKVEEFFKVIDSYCGVLAGKGLDESILQNVSKRTEAKPQEAKKEEPEVKTIITKSGNQTTIYNITGDLKIETYIETK